MTSIPPPTLGEGTTPSGGPGVSGPPFAASTVSTRQAAPDTYGGYLLGWLRRIRGGESGMLPVIGGLIVIAVIFQSQRSVFLSAGNITNLLIQAASTYILLGMAEVFVLLLGEIDLSLGYLAGVGAVVTLALVSPVHKYPWGAAIIIGLAVTAGFGALQGLLITRLRLPSFVVTLGGLLGLEGLLIFLSDREGGKNGGGTIVITNRVLQNLVSGNLSPLAGWIVMAVVVAVFGGLMLSRDRQRRANGLVAPPMALTWAKVAVAAVGGVVLVLICNSNRGSRFASVRGVPWVIPIVLAVLVIWTFLLSRTRFGRYVYAIGGNPEAARRAGINVDRIRLVCFTLGGLTAGIAGILYASRLGSISDNVNGGQLVLYAVAAAVIGGTSLFGGRGKMAHALLGGLVVATIYNGMGLVGLSAAAQYMVTALVLLAAVTVDAVARRGRVAT